MPFKVRETRVDGSCMQVGLKANPSLFNRIAPTIDSASIAAPNNGADGRVVAGRGTLDSYVESKSWSAFGYGGHPRR